MEEAVEEGALRGSPGLVLQPLKGGQAVVKFIDEVGVAYA